MAEHAGELSYCAWDAAADRQPRKAEKLLREALLYFGLAAELFPQEQHTAREAPDWPAVWTGKRMLIEELLNRGDIPYELPGSTAVN